MNFKLFAEASNNIYKKGIGSVFDSEELKGNKKSFDQIEIRAQPIVRWLLQNNFITEESCGGHAPGEPIWVTLLPSRQAWKWTMYGLFGGGYKENELPKENENWEEWIKQQKTFLDKSHFIKLKKQLIAICPKLPGIKIQILDDWHGYDRILLLSIPENVYNNFVNAIT